MAYSASYTFSALTGLTLKWSLTAAGVLHATLRNQTTGFTEQGTTGLYEWLASTIPDGYRGLVLWHTNTASAMADFTTANTYGAGSINPGEIEQVERALGRFLEMIELDGAVYRFTANAVELVPGADTNNVSVEITDTVGTAS